MSKDPRPGGGSGETPDGAGVAPYQLASEPSAGNGEPDEEPTDVGRLAQVLGHRRYVHHPGN